MVNAAHAATCKTAQQHQSKQQTVVFQVVFQIGMPAAGRRHLDKLPHGSQLTPVDRMQLHSPVSCMQQPDVYDGHTTENCTRSQSCTLLGEASRFQTTDVRTPPFLVSTLSSAATGMVYYNAGLLRPPQVTCGQPIIPRGKAPYPTLIPASAAHLLNVLNTTNLLYCCTH